MGERIPPHTLTPHRSVTALALGKARAIAAPCLPEPRHHAVKLRHGSIAPAAAVPSNPPRFATAQASTKPLACLRLAGASVGGI